MPGIIHNTRHRRLLLPVGADIKTLNPPTRIARVKATPSSIRSLKFRPHWPCRGGHLQTLAGFYWPAPTIEYKAESFLIEVSEGDHIALHDDCPDNWDPSQQVVLLIHGLTGCHLSGYNVRITQKLNALGIRVFRMDMRGTGAAAGHAQFPGHAGRSGDAIAAIHAIAERCPDAPLTMVGFSMGGNLTLGALATATRPIGNLKRGIVVAPPVDLGKSCRSLHSGLRRGYDKFLIGHLIQRWQDTGGDLMGPPPKTIYQFDDQITAPLSGFTDAEDYYAHASSGPRLREINVPTRILAAMDDPVVPYSSIATSRRSPFVDLYSTKTGGHLGFFSSKSDAPDRRWMDAQIVKWIREDW